MDESNGTGFKPPYLSFQTFWSFLHELAAKPLPPQIDRSMLDKKSGTDQANLLAALKAFGLVDGAHAVLPPLQDLVNADDAGRKQLLMGLIQSHYADQVIVSSQNGTEKQLLESFEKSFGITGDTRRKAATFFLHAARQTGMELSPHFPATRSGSGQPATMRAKRTTTKRKPAPVVPAVPNSGGQPQGDTYTVTLRSGGTVSVGVTVNLFSLSTEDRNFVMDLVDKLKGYPVDEEVGGDS